MTCKEKVRTDSTGSSTVCGCTCEQMKRLIRSVFAFMFPKGSLANQQHQELYTVLYTEQDTIPSSKFDAIQAEIKNVRSLSVVVTSNMLYMLICLSIRHNSAGCTHPQLPQRCLHLEFTCLFSSVASFVFFSFEWSSMDLLVAELVVCDRAHSREPCRQHIQQFFSPDARDI